MSAPLKTRPGPRYHGRPVTREEYLDLEDDGFQYTMVQGVLFVGPSHDPEHGKKRLRFGALLDAYLRKNPRGAAMVEVDALLPDGGDVVRPDISFVLNDRTGILLEYIHGAPDLICEVLSDSTRANDLGEKADRYLKSGVREYWLVDSGEHAVHFWINQGAAWEKRSGSADSTESRLASELLSGFTIDAADFFA
ncbi:MAG: Uma2 family endonuclease [Leptospirales bacterium]|jgi:Uma2 family endonuclease